MVDKDLFERVKKLRKIKESPFPNQTDKLLRKILRDLPEESKEKLIERLGKPHLPLSSGLQAMAIQLLEIEQNTHDDEDEDDDPELTELLKGLF